MFLSRKLNPESSYAQAQTKRDFWGTNGVTVSVFEIKIYIYLSLSAIISTRWPKTFLMSF